MKILQSVVSTGHLSSKLPCLPQCSLFLMFLLETRRIHKRGGLHPRCLYHQCSLPSAELFAESWLANYKGSSRQINGLFWKGNLIWNKQHCKYSFMYCMTDMRVISLKPILHSLLKHLCFIVSIYWNLCLGEHHFTHGRVLLFILDHGKSKT